MNILQKYKRELALLCGVLIGGGLFFLGYSRALTPSSADLGFAQDMSMHHAQAVDMSFIVSERVDNPEIRSFAYDIINTQSTQRGMMLGWLQLWGGSANSDGTMAWMNGGHHVHTPGMDMSSMMGMATKEEMAELAAASGQAAEQLFLTLMTKHHVGGVEMAESVLTQSTNRAVRSLAEAMVSGQQSELEYMSDLLSKYE